MGARKWIIGIILSVLFLISSITYAQSRSLTAEPKIDDANRIVLEYEFAKPILDKQESFDLISINGLSSYYSISEPIIPMQTVSVLIPLGKKVKEIKAVPFEITKLPGKYILFPAQKPYSRNYVGLKEFTEPNATIYTMNTPWPGNYYSKASIQSKRGYQVLLVNLFPVQFTPKSGKLMHAGKIRLEVELTDTTELQLVSPTNSVKKQLEKQVDNPASLNSYTDKQIRNIESLYKQKRRVSLIENISPKKLQEQNVFDKLSGQIKGINSKEKPRMVTSKTGYLRFLSAPDRSFFETDSDKKDVVESAHEFLVTNKELFFNKSAAIDFKVKKESSAGLNKERKFIRYNQTYAGLEVFGAEIIVQANNEGGIISVISDIMQNTDNLDSNKISLSPNINADKAGATAIGLMTSMYPKIKFELTTPELMIYDPTVLGNQGRSQLVWKTEVANISTVVTVHELVLVDAEYGTIALHYSLIEESMHRRVVDDNNSQTILKDPTGGGDDPNYPTGIYEYDKSYEYLKDAYDFYYDRFGRDSYNDSGGIINAMIDWEWDNACSDGGYLYIGKGNATDDIIGHEFTHGVVATTYYGEAGAIEESLCDMMGEWIDQTNGDGDDSNAVKWQMFEDWRCWDPDRPDWGHWPDTPCRIWRVMNDPPSVCTDSGYGDDFGSLPQPDRYYSSYWYTGNNDNGGIHHNVGVGNKLCYLLTDGDTFNGYTIEGMGIDKTASIVYECVTNLLPYATDYADLGNALIQATINLDLSLNDRLNVIRACKAVEIYTSDSNCPYYGVGDPNYKYVIITNEILADPCNYTQGQKTFQDLCDSKEANGISACIVTTEWISQNYDGNTPSGGHDLQTKIRNFLIEAYECWGVEYCLLAGSNDIVPGREFYSPEVWDWENQGCVYPSDVYYSCLYPNCTFDNDADGHYGEPNDGTDGGEIDLESEIFVGRACVESTLDVHNFLNKNFKYNESSDEYLNFLGALSIDDFNDYAEFVRDHYTYYGEEGVGFISRTLPNSRNFDVSQYFYDEDYILDSWPWDPWDDLLPLLNGENGFTSPHIVFFEGHGDPVRIYRLGRSPYFILEVNSVTPESIDFSDLTNDSNDRYNFWYLDCCLTGKFTVDDCFSEEITTRANGAFAVVASTEVIIGVGDYWPATKICCEFFNSILDDANIPSLSNAIQSAKENTLQNEVSNSQAARVAYCSMSLFGDPELKLRVQKDVSNIYNVTKDEYYLTIQDAIDDSSSGDTIELQSFIYSGQGNCDLDFDGKAITLRSTDPNDPCIVAGTIIDCNGTRNTPHRGIYFHSGETNTTIVEGISITNGYGEVQYGYYAGGAILCDGSSPTIKKCLFYSNTNDLTNEDTDGGSVACYNNSNSMITNCIFRNNSAYCAGAISLWDSEPIIQNCLIYDNNAVSGGAIYFYENGDAQVSNCTIVKNYASLEASGFYVDQSSPLITNTILRNDLSGYYWRYCSSEVVLYEGSPEFKYCNIKDSNGSGANWQSCLGTDGGGNIDTDPLFVDANANNFFLDINSPCIDVGDPNNSYTGQVDIDGDPRVYGIRVDMGADEKMGCFPYNHQDYSEWVNVGAPTCWCYPRQCHGDADGLQQGSSKTGYYYISTSDLSIFQAAWQIKESPWGPGIGSISNGICADFDHKLGGDSKSGYYRVNANDLNIITAYWQIKESPYGSGVDPNCLDY